MKNHFRPDGSCYHVVDYDPETGEVRSQETAQGYADESAWARGQSWAVYGFLECYENTGYKRYLEQAEKTWGGKLPEISKQTYDAVMKKFDDLAAQNGTAVAK